jgi:uracil-DNA glycosylase
MTKDKALRQLYFNIHSCHICPQMDKQKAQRRIDAVDIDADVFIISQALAANQLRKTGVNFFKSDGRLGTTGNRLEGFLNRFQKTVFPPRNLILDGGSRVPARRYGFFSVYNTEIAQCYPGKDQNKRGDRTPTPFEIRNCQQGGFLVDEIKIIRPRLLLLMGKTSRDAFYDYYLKRNYPKSLTKHLKQIVEERVLPRFIIGDLNVNVLPIQHASGANPGFSTMMADDVLVSMINDALQ